MTDMWWWVCIKIFAIWFISLSFCTLEISASPECLQVSHRALNVSHIEPLIIRAKFQITIQESYLIAVDWLLFWDYWSLQWVLRPRVPGIKCAWWMTYMANSISWVKSIFLCVGEFGWLHNGLYYIAHASMWPSGLLTILTISCNTWQAELIFRGLINESLTRRLPAMPIVQAKRTT